jgi:hypothetical protein
VRSATLAAILSLGLFACNEESFFTVGRDRLVCEDSIPTTCGTTARCVLDTDHYLDGDFPSGRRFLIRTAGEADVKFEIYLDDRHSPGTSLRLELAEPSCNEKTTYDSAGRDIFQASGADGILSIPMHAVRPGDHLVELSSDAYCSYVLRLSVQEITAQ